MKSKVIVTWGLLLFVAVSIGVLFGKAMENRSTTATTGVGLPKDSRQTRPDLGSSPITSTARSDVSLVRRSRPMPEAIDTHFDDALKSGD